MSDNSNNIFPFNVLIVEDESILLETARLILVKFVNQVYLAKNGKTGLEVFQEKRPEVIITDIDMPEMDGLKMSKEVLEQSSETFIVILTSYDKPEFMLDAINSGIRGFLTKP
ncbi:MAG: response regulator, partial [Leptospiraceae bacterium]|nr:response regulator [Leptospiraceae bacterium]